MAKTAFGYSPTGSLPQLPPQAPPPPAQPGLGFQATIAQTPMTAPPPRPHTPSSPPPGFPPPQAPAFQPPAQQATQIAQPAFQPPAQQATQIAQPAFQPPVLNPSSQPVNPNFVPQSASNAATMFVPPPSNAPAAGSHSPAPTPASQLATLVPGNQYAPAPIPQPAASPPPQPQFPQVNIQVKPMPAPMPIPQAMNQAYHSSPTGMTRSHRPVDAYRRSLPMMMFLWGVALLAVFATPLSTEPMAFNWTLVLDGAGMARLIPLTFAAVGLLGVLLSVIPMPTFIRGLLAALLGLAGIAVPIIVAGAAPPWQLLVPMVGALLIIPGLVLRGEYRDSLLARLLVTLGAIGMLVPYLIPQNDAIPLVALFKMLIEAPGSLKIIAALQIGQVVVIVMALLSWLPAPITGAAHLWAWLIILWGLIVQVVALLLAGDIGTKITGAPNATLLGWVVGAASDKGPMLLGAAYLVFVGYGLAAFLGKQLE